VEKLQHQVTGFENVTAAVMKVVVKGALTGLVKESDMEKRVVGKTN
jgi:hypothetical protein